MESELTALQHLFIQINGSEGASISVQRHVKESVVSQITSDCDNCAFNEIIFDVDIPWNKKESTSMRVHKTEPVANVTSTA